MIRYPEYPPDDGNDRSVMHELHVRYLSQDGLPDLRVTHRIHRVLGPDGELRRNEGVPPSFSAECIGGGAEWFRRRSAP